MAVIDADAHVIENESTWDHMLESERRSDPESSALPMAIPPSTIGSLTADSCRAAMWKRGYRRRPGT